MAKVEVSNATKTNGIGFCGLLTILFIGLKLTHFIDWSWFWVVSPLWLPLGIVLGIMAICFLIGGLLTLLVMVIEEMQKSSKKNKK